ncbi:hypothetical protein [Paraflavitalea speifideaquila]|uniref:hypothetical protein n=1 Tax=Paraflavitalea speifideaquila TaxID=3076558 RepID=UPI0028EE861C|nr:hypothetical protein [Paraflavitalea speifideiaquila]
MEKLIGKTEILQANYEEYLNEFLSLFSEFISKALKDPPEAFLIYLKNLLTYSTSPELFLSTFKHQQIKEVTNRLGSMSTEEDDIKSNLEELKSCFQISMFNGSIEEYLKPVLETKKIEDGLFKVRDLVKDSRNNLDRKIYIISSEILEIVRKMKIDE